MRHLPRLLLAGVLLAGLTACPMSPERACERTLVEGCQHQKRCDGESFDRFFDSIADCVEETGDALRIIGLSCDAVDEGTFCPGSPESYNAWNAGACVRQTGAQACDDNSTPDPCDEICNG
ncbi:MAG: hypothetical protein P1V51_22045 [Deltaproteobacteria bacterium]|nr:hypothetical protein [Deltaproteobacteria bacterium]